MGIVDAKIIKKLLLTLITLDWHIDFVYQIQS